MELNEVKILVDKYFDGTTSHEEEIEIANYLSTHENIPDELIPLKAMFSSFEAIKRVESPVAPAKPKTKTKLTLNIDFRSAITAISAACIMIAFIVAGLMDMNSNKYGVTNPSIVCHVNGEMVDEAMARAEADRIIGGVSNHLLVAMTSVNKITKRTNID